MKIIYLISIIILLLSFLLIEKNNQKLSIIKSIIYTICLFFCYQTVIVCLLSYLNLGGHILNYSIANFLISLILSLRIIKKKKIQKYYFNKLELLLTLLVVLTISIIVTYRFRGFQSLSYISDDSSIHYRASKIFSEKLSILNDSNANDLIYNFTKMMPMFYINCGFILKLLSFIPSYKAFMINEAICLVLYSLLFLITILKEKDSNYIYTYIVTILYALAYPLNNLIFGFSYLGCGIMTINLLLYTMKYIKDDLKNNKILKIIILFILNFSLFNSYYLFVPFTYLSLEIYYLSLKKNKKITTKNMLIYSILTLIIPFIIGLTYFVLPSFFNAKINVIKAITLNGDIYNNIAPLYLFIFTTTYLVYEKIKHKTKTNYFLLNFYILTAYTLLFLILYILKISATYYFYKLFYIYWLFFSIYIAISLDKKKKIMYISAMIILISMAITITKPYSSITSKLEKLTIYTYNSRKFNDDWIRLSKEDLDIIKATIKYKDICKTKEVFPITGRGTRNAWFYSITGTVPNIYYKKKNRNELYVQNISFNEWQETDYKCILFFKENTNIDIPNEYHILYQNDKGILLTK